MSSHALLAPASPSAGAPPISSCPAHCPLPHLLNALLNGVRYPLLCPCSFLSSPAVRVSSPSTSMAQSRVLLQLASLVALCCVFVSATDYEINAEIPLYANKIGPYHNPSEQYEYFTIPICEPKEEERKWHNLGEAIGGDRLVKTRFKIQFRKEMVKQPLCDMMLKQDEVLMLKEAIRQDYFFEMFFDDLPVWGFYGEVRPKLNSLTRSLLQDQNEDEDEKRNDRLILFTHYTFIVSVNGPKVIEIAWEGGDDKNIDLTDVEENLSVGFTYTVKWKDVETDYVDRAQKYVELQSSQGLEIHWFSIMNSVVTAVLLTGFLATILIRVLKNDFTRYARADLEDQDEEEESGWKLVHGDVFRPPSNPLLFASLLGSGVQLLCLVVGLLILAVLGVFYHTNRGALFVAALLVFSFTSCVSGYVSNSWYQKLGGTNWTRCTLVTYFMYLGPFFVVATLLNFVAISKNSSIALPFGTICVILLILLLVSLPLCVLGGIAGKNYGSPLNAPCRTNKIARQIPDLPWYRHSFFQSIMAGFLPFSAIYIEISELFAAVWGFNQSYTLYGILSIVFTILLIVTSFITIALTYFQLAAEDHRWWWRAVSGGGSTGLFIMAKCFHFWSQSKMSGVLQASFFFGYMGVLCYGAVLMLGAIGFLSSMAFVRYIYSNVKID